MAKKEKNNCCDVMGKNIGCCKVESLISVDERGQMVLPKEIRDKAGIKSGDKLVIITWKREGNVCCISLVKSEDFTIMVKDLLGPMFKEMMNKGGKR